MTLSKNNKKSFHKRIRQLRRVMEEDRLDGFLITHLPNVRYLAGFTGSSGSLIVEPGSTCFISDSRYREQAAREVQADDILILDGGGPTSRIAEFVKEKKYQRLGFESRSFSYWQYEQLGRALPKKCSLVPETDRVETLRQVKDEGEIQLMKQAARIGDKAFRETLKEVRQGMTELELAALLRFHLEKNGGSKPSFDAIVKFGPGSSIIHGQPGKAKLKRGQLILFDFGTTYQGYCSDMTRTVAFGKVEDEIRQAYQAVLTAQKKAVAAVRAGRKTDRIDAVARDGLKEAGWGEYFSHGTGHSLGLEIHEDPRLSMYCSEPLKANMVVTVEPGVYLPGRFGIRIEDMVRVTAQGPEVLTKTPKKWVEV
jgi:Xaa-Pro aminopeptidase